LWDTWTVSVFYQEESLTDKLDHLQQKKVQKVTEEIQKKKPNKQSTYRGPSQVQLLLILWPIRNKKLERLNESKPSKEAKKAKQAFKKTAMAAVKASTRRVPKQKIVKPVKVSTF
jgi:large subunit ribosomal protein L24e